MIFTGRHTADDVQAWRRWEMLDQRLAACSADRLSAMSDNAVQVMRDFGAGGSCYVSCSWGRDSVVIADLVARYRLGFPIAYATSADVPGRAANPDSPLVRDQFLSRYPDVDYREFGGGLGGLGRYVGVGRYVSGVRGDESRQRGHSVRRHGLTTPGTCRPIGRWESVDIWAYLAWQRLPVHPAYAMTFGGAMSRDLVRVHSFGGSDGRGKGRLRWEDAYYRDVVAALRGCTAARPT